MAPIFDADDSELIEELFRLHKSKPKLVRYSEYNAPAAPEMIIQSWKMNEFKYYDIPSPFPTLARGLFTTELDKEGKARRYRIVARGYDKFFNIGEVPWTAWGSLESHTKPPYLLTLKSNGCIIFAAALTPSKLLVTSKHSLGPVEGQPESHAEAGERWLHRHLEDAGKTTQEFAKVLWDNNWTAILELCDDSFEEHVLPYPPEKAGLRLHGLNECSRSFKTMPPDFVIAFAKEWGFIPTPFTVLNTIPEVKSFTEEISETGEWQGEALEGFVVRTTVSEPPTGSRGGRGASPYKAGSSFFFKVKFDEPYMMYRDWREATKRLLTANGSIVAANISKSKMMRPETRLYVDWVAKEIKRDKMQFKDYNKGKGIIGTRNRFLAYMESETGKKGQQELEHVQENASGSADGKKFGKTIIMPVAIPGCGKTTIAVALVHLFGFGHTQSDDVRAKKAGPAFIKNVKQLLQTYDVVIADKNNHLRQHRQALRDLVKKDIPPTRLLALNWSLDLPLSTIARICGDRVYERGDRHQTLRADPLVKTHEDVIWHFINTAEELADNEVDASIEMDLTDSLEDAIERAVNGCPEAKTKIKGPPPPRYFGLMAEVGLEHALGPAFEEENVPQKAKELWQHLMADQRVAKRPHVTVVHLKTREEEPNLWKTCETLHKLSSPPLFKFAVRNVVCNERIMAAVVEDLELQNPEQDDGQHGHEFLATLPPDIRSRLHITVGTKDSSVNPVEAKEMVEEWRKNANREDIVTVPVAELRVSGRIKGLV
ncbi:hypothetical protein EWM64_g1998 [Hericium alpestre]|uniref:tRNA ligase n=1 Tax=Hericium alpestre TaxID=135208 RepID=A0A4Z0A7W5_9AGAM|nr:hypothetical protein EWM64_g1998 [Hericium alpestre]